MRPGCSCTLVCFRRHCPMFIINQVTSYLGSAISIQSPDFVRCTHRYAHCFRHQSWRLRGRTGSWFILRFFIVLVWIHRLVLWGTRWIIWLLHFRLCLLSFWFCGYSLLCSKVDLLLMRRCGSTASDSPSVSWLAERLSLRFSRRRYIMLGLLARL